MKIYTRTGDDGTSALFGGQRVQKSDLRIEAYGTVDELNAYIGWLADIPVNEKRAAELRGIQETLFTVGAMLATVPGNTKVSIPRLGESEVDTLEQAIDGMERSLPALKTFILPGGNDEVSRCHVARTVCRRAERRVVALHAAAPVAPVVLKYLNRLSDYLFVLARTVAREMNVGEKAWKPKENSDE